MGGDQRALRLRRRCGSSVAVTSAAADPGEQKARRLRVQELLQTTDSMPADMKRLHRPGSRAASGIAAGLLLCLVCAACANGVGVTTSSAPPTSTTTSTSTTTTSTTTTTTTTLPPTTTTTVPTPETRPISADEPLVVWFIGDSLATSTGEAFAATAGATGIVDTIVDTVGGTGLASPAYFDWPLRAAERLPELQPDVVVVVLGTNDGQGMNAANGWVDFGTPEWEQAYSDIAGLFMDRLADGSTWVYWAGPPVMGIELKNQQAAVITRLIGEQADTRYEVTYLDTFPLFSDENGDYTDVLLDENGVLIQVRYSDGIHFTSQGARLLADTLLVMVAADWGFEDLVSG
jgi:hypothetical protein